MIEYRDNTGDSDVEAYEYGEDFIRVRFKDGGIYHYSYQSAGAESVEHMKKLAYRGNGLNTFIKKYVKNDYVRKC